MIATNIATIVPFFNRRHTILGTLESVQSQSHRPAQLIVVDDGSTDGGGEAVLEWMEQNRGSLDCRLIQQTKSGAAVARNHGLSQARPSEFVAFLDSDDIWPVNFLERTCSALSARECAVAATCDRHYIFADGRPSVTNDCSALSVDPSLWMVKFGAGVASATLFRTQAIRSRGGFPALATGEDAALFMPLSLDGPWLHVPGQPVVFQTGLAEKLGDESSLSRKFTDNGRRWAAIYEEFFTSGAGLVLLARSDCKETMALAWYRAGKEMWHTHSPREALACFQRSWSWDPWQGRCYVRILRAWLKMIGRFATPVFSDRRAMATSVAVAQAARR